MRKNLLLVFLLTSIIFSSCSKRLEDRLIGNWQVTDAWRQGFLSRDYFRTGYESGIFTFMENGNATYVSATDTMTGVWHARRYSDGYYDQTGNWQTSQRKFLTIDLVNFQQNLRLEWQFDDFSFRNGFREIKAETFDLANKTIIFKRR